MGQNKYNFSFFLEEKKVKRGKTNSLIFLFLLFRKMADYSKWKIVDLKQELSNRKLPVSGTKADLVRRLTEDTPIVASEPPPPKKVIHFDAFERVPTGLRTKTQEMFENYSQTSEIRKRVSTIFWSLTKSKILRD